MKYAIVASAVAKSSEITPAIRAITLSPCEMTPITRRSTEIALPE